jgi:Zn-dependent protease/CBS domain-containing protein
MKLNGEKTKVAAWSPAEAALNDASRNDVRKTMSGSWRIGRIARIDVYVHFTFLILFAWVAGMHYMAHRSIGEAVVGALFILALFLIVVLHELGHALAARRYGIATRDIILLPIGGVARLERMPDDPKQELVVALAGPAVNIVLAAAIFVGLKFGSGLVSAGEAANIGAGFLSQLFYVNVVLALFNLLPAFPMDGGRVLRAFLAMRMDYMRATQVAATIGQAMAILFFFGGLFGPNPFLMFIGLFVWLGATQEASFAQMRSAIGGIPVMRAMVTDFYILHPDDPLSKAVKYMLAGFQQDFPIVEDGRLVGVLTQRDLAAALARDGEQTRIRDAMQRDFVAISPNEMLESAFSRLQDCNCHTLPVVQDGRLLGVLTTDNVTEVLMIQEALRANADRRQAPDRTAAGRRQKGPLKLAGAP